MTDADKVGGLAGAGQVRQFIGLFKEKLQVAELAGFVLDIGCGDGHLSEAFSREFPNCLVHGVDGDTEKLFSQGRLVNRGSDLESQVAIIHGILPQAALTAHKYDVVISLGLLGKLNDPMTLWRTVRNSATGEAWVFVADGSGAGVEALRSQLAEADLPLAVESDGSGLTLVFGRLRPGN